jgi:hypothetical protein
MQIAQHELTRTAHKPLDNPCRDGSMNSMEQKMTPKRVYHVAKLGISLPFEAEAWLRGEAERTHRTISGMILHVIDCYRGGRRPAEVLSDGPDSMGPIGD